MITFDEIYQLLPFEFLCNKSDAVYGLWQRTSYQHEYGISWNDFLNEYDSEIRGVLSDWFEEVTDEEVIEWLQTCRSNMFVDIEQLSRDIERIDEYIKSQEENK